MVFAVWSESTASTATATVNLKTLSSSTIDTASSSIKIGYWTFTPASILTGTINNFAGTFASATTEEMSIENINIVSSSFSATNDDYSSNDDMTWGVWNTTITYDMEAIPTTDNLSGLWVAGANPTESSVIEGYLGAGSMVTYNGKYKAIEVTDGSISTGTAMLQIDFGVSTPSASLTLGSIATYSGIDVSPSGIKMTQTGSDTGEAIGNFYGVDGKSVAGSFYIQPESSGITTQGVYQVTTTDSISTQ